MVFGKLDVQQPPRYSKFSKLCHNVGPLEKRFWTHITSTSFIEEVQVIHRLMHLTKMHNYCPSHLSNTSLDNTQWTLFVVYFCIQ